MWAIKAVAGSSKTLGKRGVIDKRLSDGRVGVMRG